RCAVRMLLTLAVLFQLLVLPASAQEAPRAAPLNVVATTTHIADFARTVAGDRAVVVSLLPVNADPHSYEPVPGDVATLAGADGYRSRAAQYKQRLTRLDRELKTMIEEIPRENRLMVTNHDAFHYYTDHFGLTFVGSVIPGTSTEAETSAGSLGRLIRLMLDRHVNAVFTE